MSDIFGDIELADVWDDDPTIDALQVARRLRLLQVRVDFLAGINTPAWRELGPLERDRLESFAERIVEFVLDREPDNPAALAERIHEERSLQSWDDLSPDEQQIAIDLVDLFLDWLEREGPR